MKNLLLKVEKINLLFSFLRNKQVNSQPISFITSNVFKCLLIFFSFTISANSYSQAASATWALTSNGNAITTGAVTASSLAIGSGINTPTYTANGVTTDNWANDSTVRLGDEYYEYKVTPNIGKILTVSSVELKHSVSANSWRAAVYYSYDNFATAGVQIGGNFTSSSTTPTLWSSTGLSLVVPSGGSFTIRVFAWESDGSNIKFRNKDVVIQGNCINDTEINLTGGGNPIVDGSTIPSGANLTNFGSTTVIGGTINSTFTIQNTGTGTLTISNPTISGTNAADFTIITYPSTTTITAGSSVTFTVRFDPSAAGTRTATINIINDDANENPYDFAISGNGTEQEIDILGGGNPIVDGSTIPSGANLTNFGSTTVIGGTINSTFTIQNTGTTTLTISNPTISGTNAADFTIITYPSTTSIAAGSSVTFTVRFDPSAAGTRTATINIINDDANENPYDFAISGNGTEQEIDIRGGSPSISILNNDLIPTTTDWTDFSTVTNTRTYTIYNTGTLPLTIGTISLTNPTEFSVTTNPTSPVAAGSSTTFTVTFTPTAAGTRSTDINIVNNDSNENPYRFRIQGTGVLPSMTVKGNNIVIADGDTSPSSSDWTDFNSTNIYSAITRVYTISNIGNMNLNLSGSPIVSVSGSTDFTVTVLPTTPVLGNSSVTFTVSFAPTIIGTKTADISIANNDAGVGKNPYNFRITGNAIQAFPDSDSDGVFNNVDSDDDNDGIPDNIEQNYASGSVLGTQVQVTLLNETFGTGTTRTRINSNVPSASTTYCYEDGTTAQAADECDTQSDLNDGQYTVHNIAGTTAVASWAPTYWYQGVDHTSADTNGRMALFNATNDITDEFYRTIVQGVITNAPLTYSFYVLNLDRSDAPGIGSRNRPNLTVEFRDLSNNLISTINTGDIAPTTAGNLIGDWYQFTATFTPLTTGFSIIFKNNQLGGTGNDLALDDILITQILTDSDQDSKADAYDLDSDNDGVGGIIEDGWATLSNGLDRMDRATPGVWIDANGNGWHDTVESYYASNSTKNFDGDSVPNYIDLDSDNDSRFDVDEAGLYNGDGDVNGDGEGEGTDADSDGIVGIFDSLSGFGNTGKATPTNTLGTGNPDYLKLMSTTGVYDISTTLYASLDANNNGIIDGSTDVDRDGILDSFDTSTTVYGSPRDLNRKLLLDFDGRNDYAEDSAILGGLANATLMAWIDLNSTFSTDGVVVGQDKFQIRVTSAKKLEVVVNTTTYTYSTLTLNTAQWYHVAAVYNSSSLKLYLNGTLLTTQTISGSIVADATKLTLGRNPAGTDKYFKGKIDEVRVFNVALNDAQVQRMVYQEIQNTSSQVRGTIVPKDISSLPFANVLRYYRMDAYKNDIVDNLTTPSIDTGTGMKLYNHKNIYVQQAPMPFVTKRTGTFATAVNDTPNDIRGLDIMDQDWSIVQVKHNITETANNTDLAMFIDSGVTVNMTNDTKIQNDWYLKLDGKIDLVGKSQLVQTTNSDLDVTSSGSVERDQQGQSIKFNYNYWSSPVSSINSTTINHGFTVAGVMKDGTTTTPQNITWTTSVNGAATSPITLSSYWIFKFQNLNNSYANWASVGQNGTLLAGQGFTMKGSAAATATQNYTFVGKPNNGTITSTVSANNLNLCGNPYTSAIDANQFIDDNATSIKGTIYFWEHYNSNTSHNTVQYQGGYATYTKTGGTAPVAPAGISGLGSSSKTPKRFIPVGQGFFVTGTATGGTITYNNGQRLFVKEDDASSYTLFKNNSNPTVSSNPATYNNNDSFITEEFMKLRLGFNSTDNYHRQILLGFMNENATAGYDEGYDGISIETLTNDMYFINGTNKLNIQGDGSFNVNNIYPLGVKNEVAGNVKFVVDDKENFNNDQEIYIYDSLSNIYHSIKSQDFEINLPAGVIEDRFSLRFTTASALGTNENELQNEIVIAHTQSNNVINIKNEMLDNTIKSVLLFNLVGQNVLTWEIDNPTQTNIELPVTNLSTGAYIVKVITDKGDITKKILVK